MGAVDGKLSAVFLKNGNRVFSTKVNLYISVNIESLVHFLQKL